MPSQETFVSTGQTVLRKNADNLKQRGANTVIQVFRGQFFLPGLGQTEAYIGDKFGTGVGSKGLGQHAVLRNQSVSHAAKSCVNILVVRLKPVAKRAAQHAGGGARRSSFHDVVLAVEEVRGVARIKRKPLEAGKWLELARCPLPPVAQ